MADLQINLPDPISEFAGDQVASGRFPTLNDYLGALVSADEQSQNILRELSENPQLAALLEEGLGSRSGRHWSPDVLRAMKQQVLDRSAGNGT